MCLMLTFLSPPPPSLLLSLEITGEYPQVRIKQKERRRDFLLTEDVLWQRAASPHQATPCRSHPPMG